MSDNKYTSQLHYSKKLENMIEIIDEFQPLRMKLVTEIKYIPVFQTVQHCLQARLFFLL